MFINIGTIIIKLVYKSCGKGILHVIIHNLTLSAHWVPDPNSLPTKYWVLISTYVTHFDVHHVWVLQISISNTGRWPGFRVLGFLTTPIQQTTYYYQQYQTRSWMTSNTINPRSTPNRINMPKLAIWALSWLMGMAWAGASFLKFLTSCWVTFIKSKCIQIPNLVGVNFEIWRPFWESREKRGKTTKLHFHFFVCFVLACIFVVSVFMYGATNPISLKPWLIFSTGILCCWPL